MDVETRDTTLLEFADGPLADCDLVEFLQTVVDRCAELLDVSAVGLMLADRGGRLKATASTGEAARLLFGPRADEGPCGRCHRTGMPVQERDLAAAAARWPGFAPEAVRAGFRAVHALPVPLRSETVGVLALLHPRPGALRPSDVATAQALVDVAAFGLIQMQERRRREVLVNQLQTALDSRVVVEQAKGVLAERHRVTPAQAFVALREHARSTNLKLADLAHAVVAGQALPVRHPRPRAPRQDRAQSRAGRVA